MSKILLYVWQTMQTLTRCRVLRRLILLYTICKGMYVPVLRAYSPVLPQLDHKFDRAFKKVNGHPNELGRPCVPSARNTRIQLVKLFPRRKRFKITRLYTVIFIVCIHCKFQSLVLNKFWKKKIFNISPYKSIGTQSWPSLKRSKIILGSSFEHT